MKLLINGNGGAFDDDHSSFIIDEVLAVDCGHSFVRNCRENGIDPLDVRSFIITHAHGDHFHGLETIGFMNRSFGREKPEVFVGSMNVYIDIVTALGVSMNSWGGSPSHPTEFFKFTVTNKNEMFELFPVRHVFGLDSFGVTFHNKFMISGDTSQVQGGHGLMHVFHDASQFGGVHCHVSNIPDYHGKYILYHCGQGVSAKHRIAKKGEVYEF